LTKKDKLLLKMKKRDVIFVYPKRKMTLSSWQNIRIGMRPFICFILPFSAAPSLLPI